jgi:hypothetical protein
MRKLSEVTHQLSPCGGITRSFVDLIERAVAAGVVTFTQNQLRPAIIDTRRCKA